MVSDESDSSSTLAAVKRLSVRQAMVTVSVQLKIFQEGRPVDGFISMQLKRFRNMARCVAMRKEKGNLITPSKKASLWPRNSVGFVVLRTQQAHLYCREFDPTPLSTWAGTSTRLLRLQPERKTDRKRPKSGRGRDVYLVQNQN